MNKLNRTSVQNRVTNETSVKITVNIDGTGEYDIKTGNGMFDHLLSQLSRHGLIDLNIQAQGDEEVGWHHLVEDTAITLGKAFKQSVGEGKGMVRMGHTYVPLDEALVLTVIDYSGRGYASIDCPLTESVLGGLPSDLIRHFMEAFAIEGGFNMHLNVLAGINNHHIAEACFKSLARSMRAALTIDPRQENQVASTKGTISSP
jgi:imidazoleglycerol-phosphate dehydratase